LIFTIAKKYIISYNVFVIETKEKGVINMNKKVKEMYSNVIASNEGVTEKNVRSLFIWYDLFSYALSFQLIFIFAYSTNLNYATTMFSVIFIIMMDVLLKNVLDKDSKSYQRLANQLALVKLWTIPLLILGILTTVALLVVTFGLI
jgi:hypothetical protein